ncbi:MAG: glycine zipper 2TM domain-containing protein [Agarilytica sp.]
MNLSRLSVTQISLLLCSLILTPSLSADEHARGKKPHYRDKHQFTDFAKVKQATAQYKTFEHRIPEEKCWTETVVLERYEQPSRTGALLGGLIGGTIGHAVGHGRSNKKLGAVVGSVLGASIGKDVSQQRHNARNQPNRTYDEVERCEVEYHSQYEERIIGYDVTYQYRGEFYHTFMKKHPGKRIRVNVAISPVIEH